MIVLVLMTPTLLGMSVSGQEWERSTNITVPAVKEDTGEGILITLSISIKPGTGRVHVSAGEVGDITKYSLIQAAVTGTLLAGRDWRLYDYEFRFYNASSVNGPSASAAAATAIYLMLSGSPMLEVFANTTVMTGAITPVGLYSAIGGVEAKCQAATSVGALFVYPYANYMPDIRGCEGDYVAAAGILGAVETLEGMVSRVSPPLFSMPRPFMDSMKNASIYMATIADNILKDLEEEGVVLNNTPAYIEVVKALDEANRTRETLPYVSASKAFYALYMAFNIYYAYKVQQLTGEGLVDYVREESRRLLDNLTALQSNLSLMPGNGSSYYVEFLGTAFARIASAMSELEKAPVLAQANPLEAIGSLAYARVRIYSVHAWVESAKSVMRLDPVLNESQVKGLASVSGDYAHIAVDYSVSIANYMIENYEDSVDKQLLETSVHALTNILSRGDEYLSRGNYVAALGFYREALSQSMNSVFSIVIANISDPSIIYKAYLNESSRIYTRLAAVLAWNGLPPGMAPAYMEYALYEANNGRLDTALGLARSALASALIWYLFSITENISPQALPPPGSLPETSPVTGQQLALIAVAVLSGFLVGLVVLGNLYRRALERVAR